MLLHGMWSTGATLDPIRRRFEALGYRCIAPTLPHHEQGGNVAAVGNLSHLDYVEAHLATIQQQNWDTPPILVGHSMGGTLAQLLAARTQTSALVLFAPGLPAGGFALSQSAVRSTFHITSKAFWWRKAHKHPSLKSANYALFNNLPVARQVELFDSLVHESGRCIFEAGFWPIDRRKATRIDTSSVRVPILVLHGTNDRIVTINGSRSLTKRYPDISLREYAGSGHWLFEEAKVADSIFNEVARWLTERGLHHDGPAIT